MLLLFALVYYRPPHYLAEDLTCLSNSLEFLSKIISHSTVVIGNFNLPNIDWVHHSAPTNPFYEMFIQFVNNFGLRQYVLVPTRFSASGACNIHDLVFTDMCNLISDLVLCPLSTVDHNMVKFIVNIPCISNTNKTVVNELYRDFKIAHYEMIETFLCGIDWASGHMSLTLYSTLRII